MGDFKRSPSKVWWLEDNTTWRLHSSASPGSQDSGFSDSEILPTQKTILRVLTKDDQNDPSKTKNTNEQYKEKVITEKNLPFQSNKQSTPKTALYQKRTRKNLFKTDQTTKAAVQNNQYAKGDKTTKSQQQPQISSEVTFNGSLQESISTASTHQQRLNRSAPAVLGVLKENEERAEEENNDEEQDDISDCDSEIENFFRGAVESPKHTSTPKSGRGEMRQCKRKAALNLHHAKFQRERIPPVDVMSRAENPSVRIWLQNVRMLYETECMTTLQCKSISAELTQKVLNIAGKITAPIREVLTQSHTIEKEFDNLKSQTKYKGPLAQNLVCTLTEFLKAYDDDVDTSSACRLCDTLRRSNPLEIPTLCVQLDDTFRNLRNELLVNRVLRLTEKLENPTSELEFRAMLTGITSLCLRYESLIDMFINAGAVATLLIFCEKCDGSSVRIAVLRALSTICYNDTAVRQLEKASGIQLICEILADQSRPEPELSESIALLAQITAPWIDGNHKNLYSLQTEGRRLIDYLTKFLSTTNCCQNMLLCAAALANITSVNPRCVKYILQQNTIKTLFEAVQKRGPHGSIYLLEQVATLLANMSSSEEARKQLIAEKAPAVLLIFLQSIVGKGEEVEKRLQQKAIIALSRLCSDRVAAEQMVSLGGVQKLVQLCREKRKRFNSDAVLVAALATLRKIVDCCGPSVINPQDAQELVEPRLLDSFLAYSAQNESYV